MHDEILLRLRRLESAAAGVARNWRAPAARSPRGGRVGSEAEPSGKAQRVGEYIWTGDGDNGFWSTKENWGDAGPPKKGDSARIPSYVNGPQKGAVVDASVDQLKSLTLESGYVAGGPISVVKEVHWLGGDILSRLEVLPGCRMTIATLSKPEKALGRPRSAVPEADKKELLNRGTVFVSDDVGRISIAEGWKITNGAEGTFEFAGSHELLAGGHDELRGAFVNLGVLRISGAPLGTAPSVTFRASLRTQGRVDVGDARGELVVRGPLNVLHPGALFSGPGRTRVVGGRTTIATEMGTTERILRIEPRATVELGRNPDDLEAIFTGDVKLAGAGKLVWTGGELHGRITVPEGETMAVEGADPKLLGQVGANPDAWLATIRNRGTLELRGGGPVAMRENGLIENDGKLVVSASQRIEALTAAHGLFRHRGTLVVTSAAGATSRTAFQVAAPSWIAGEVDARSGDVELSRGIHSLRPRARFKGKGAIRLAGRETAVEQRIRIDSGTTVELAAETGGTSILRPAVRRNPETGKDEIGEKFVLDGALRWSGGEIVRDLQILPRSSLEIVGEGAKVLGRGIHNAGRMRWLGTAEVGGDEVLIVNDGDVELGSGVLRCSFRAKYTQGRGRTTLDGGEIVAGTIALNGGTLSGNGTLSGELVNAARLAPRGRAPALRIGQSYVQTQAGTLDVELSPGAGRADAGLLEIVKAAKYAGALEVTYGDGYAPGETGESFVVATFESQSESLGFTAVDTPVVPNRVWLLLTPPKRLELTLQAAGARAARMRVSPDASVERGEKVTLDDSPSVGVGDEEPRVWTFRSVDESTPIDEDARKEGRKVEVVLLADVDVTLEIGERDQVVDTSRVRVRPRGWRCPEVTTEPHMQPFDPARPYLALGGLLVQFYNGLNHCARESPPPPGARKDTKIPCTHVIHRPCSGSGETSWREVFEADAVDDPGGPFHGMHFLKGHTMEIRRRLYISRWIWKGGRGAEIYDHNVREGSPYREGIDAVLRLTQAHEKAHSELIEQACRAAELEAGNPIEILEANVQKEREHLLAGAEGEADRLEKLLNDATNEAAVGELVRDAFDFGVTILLPRQESPTEWKAVEFSPLWVAGGGMADA